MLTPKQKDILDFILKFGAKRGYAPSQQEIADHFGFKSLGTVQNYIVRLERQGLLRKIWNARRGMQILHPAAPQPLAEVNAGTIPLPLLGRVAAGRPIEAVQANETVDVPSSMVKAGAETFVLKVVGDSMIEDGILDGDYAVIRKRADAHNGETVVALINNEATIKKFYRRGGKIELHPANPAYKPIVVDPGPEHQLRIEGVLAGILRLYR